MLGALWPQLAFKQSQAIYVQGQRLKIVFGMYDGRIFFVQSGVLAALAQQE